MIYRDFDLWIDSDGNNRCLIRAEAPTAAQGEFRLDETAYDVLINTAATAEKTSVKSAAEDLFNHTFPAEVGRLYQQCVGGAVERDVGIRLRLRTNTERVAEIPWELMSDGKHFLGASTKTVVIRYLPGVVPPLEIKPLVNVLILSPQESGATSVAATIADALREFEPMVAVHFKPGELTSTAIRDALRERKYQIVHFVAPVRYSETREPRLAIDGDVGSELDADAISLFFEGDHPTKLVILNSVASDVTSNPGTLFPIAARLVTDSLPAAVAFRHPLNELAARLFARELYLSLCRGDDHGRVDVAVACARRSLCQQFPNRIDFIAPVVFTRSGSGKIFSFPDEKKATVESVRQLHTAQTVVDTHDANREIFEQQKNDAGPEEKAQIQEQIDAESAAAKPTAEQIRRWRKKVIIRSALATLGILAACWIGLFGVLNLDEYLERKFVSFMDSSIEKPIAPQLRMITIKEGEKNGNFEVLQGEDAKWRANYAKLIRDLAQAGAKTIVLDVFFDNKQLTPEENEATDKLLAAVSYAQQPKQIGEQTKQTGVIAAVKTEQGKIVTEMPDQLKQLFAGYRGDASNLRRQWWSRLIREVRLATVSPDVSAAGCADGETAVLPSLPLLAVMHFRGATKACLGADQNEIRVRDDSQNLIKSVPVFSRYSRSGETLMVNKLDLTPASKISDFSKPIEKLYNDQQTLARPGDYADSIVVIGVTRQGECFGPDERDIWCVTDSEPGERNGKRFGVEIQANVISNLLTDIYINPVSISVDLLLIALMVGLGVVFQTVGRSWLNEPIAIPIPGTNSSVPIPVLLFVVSGIYLFLIFVAYQKSRLLFSNAPYHILALVVSYYMMRRLRKRLALK
ncbi:MAG TPA: CHASE2 domain-containing protein [Pyrinomonadaceae bacterium]